MARPPKPTATQSWRELNHYLLTYFLNTLRPAAQFVANNGSLKSTIVVMVLKYGYTNLFINYVCAAVAVGVDFAASWFSQSMSQHVNLWSISVWQYSMTDNSSSLCWSKKLRPTAQRRTLT
jgi:hypothetical protein